MKKIIIIWGKGFLEIFLFSIKYIIVSIPILGLISLQNIVSNQNNIINIIFKILFVLIVIVFTPIAFYYVSVGINKVFGVNEDD